MVDDAADEGFVDVGDIVCDVVVPDAAKLEDVELIEVVVVEGTMVVIADLDEAVRIVLVVLLPAAFVVMSWLLI